MMGMSIDEIIKNENEIAAELQKVFDTHIVNDDGFTVEEMYCDDTDAVNDHLSRCKSLADYHKQIADVMNKYQKIVEIAGNYGFNTSWLCLKKIGKVIEDENGD